MIAQGMTLSFKTELFQGVHNFSTDTFKIALYVASANLDSGTTVYSTTGEVSGGGYIAGGNVLTGTTVSGENLTAYVDFADSAWTPANFTARAALIYNSSKGNKSVAVLDFGSDKTGAASFTVQMPANTASDALLRI